MVEFVLCRGTGCKKIFDEGKWRKPTDEEKAKIKSRFEESDDVFSYGKCPECVARDE